MRRLVQVVLLGIVIGVFALLTPQSAQAQQRYPYDDGYWGNYWRWYDRDYSPYYHRRYYRQPYPYNYNYGYRPGYRTPYYYRGYRDWGPGGGVQVGPLGVYWR